MTPTRPLAEEREALRTLLGRLMNEESSLDTLCKHVPRIVSVAANVARIQAGLEATGEEDAMNEVLKALAELAAEAENDEQEGFDC